MTLKLFMILNFVLLCIILGLNSYIIMLVNKKKEIKDNYCNCFASQYNGSEANPTIKSYYGGYCYDKDRITRLYEDGVYESKFAGV